MVKKAHTKQEEIQRRAIVDGKYLCRMTKNESGMYEDEIRTLPNGKKIKVVFPYTIQRSEKHNFRDMVLSEIEEHFENLREDKQLPYGVLERKLKEKEEELSKALNTTQRAKLNAMEAVKEAKKGK